MVFDKPGGKIELAISGCCCPPGTNRPGMHTSACTLWWRVDNEDNWNRHPYGNTLRELAEAAEDVEDFLLAVSL